MTTAQRKRHDTTLAAAVGHPIRSRCLVILAERVASPAEIARTLGIDVSKIGYHVSALAERNLIEEVSNRPVRGATEHFYKAVTLPLVSDEQWSSMSIPARRTYTEAVLSVHAANAAHSLADGTFFERPNHHMTRYAFNSDEQGWEDATAAYMELYGRIFEIQREITQRSPRTEEKPFRVVSFLSFFEVPADAQ